MNQNGLSQSSAKTPIGSTGIILHFHGPVTIVLENLYQPKKSSSEHRLPVKYQRRLQKLKEKEALLGINTPPEVLMEIEDLEEKITEFEAE